MTDVKPTFIMYKEAEPLAGLQRLFDSQAEDKVAEIIIPCEFMSSNNRRVREGDRGVSVKQCVSPEPRCRAGRGGNGRAERGGAIVGLSSWC